MSLETKRSTDESMSSHSRRFPDTEYPDEFWTTKWRGKYGPPIKETTKEKEILEWTNPVRMVPLKRKLSEFGLTNHSISTLTIV